MANIYDAIPKPIARHVDTCPSCAVLVKMYYERLLPIPQDIRWKIVHHAFKLREVDM